MSKFKVDITGVNTNDIIVLTSEETNELFRKYQAGDLQAKDDLVNGNLRLVLSVLKSFNNQKHDMNDLFQVGVIGLIKAIDNFDLSYNLRLSTYAIPLIVGEIKRYIRDNTMVRVSRSVKDLAYQIMRYKEAYYNKNGVEASTLDIAKELNIDEYQVNYALDSLKEPVSIFEPIFNDGGDTIYLLDQIADNKEKNEDKDLYISLYNALNSIGQREHDIIIDRFIMGKTQTEIAENLNISQAQVSRIEKSALKNVKRLIK
ncbi:MAG: sigma-70 family RNA polymerase sigma factor [Bacilli bacterium]|nr:sigma-70 family RNA polymerase sigma factor [Bacilli bacterium]